MRNVLLGRSHAALTPKPDMRVMHIGTSRAARFMRGEPSRNPSVPRASSAISVRRMTCPTLDLQPPHGRAGGIILRHRRTPPLRCVRGRQPRPQALVRMVDASS